MSHDENLKSVSPGDWVRFYRNGVLVIGQVEYIEVNSIFRRQIYTDIGITDIDSIKEVRHKNHINGSGER